MNIKDSYNYIIVGAGSAGCVLANRLSADPDVSVLLLEAGGRDDDPRIAVPRRWGELLESPVDWDYFTEPESSLNGRSIKWPRGKVLGGSSSINAMIYIRGNPADYDHWDELGNGGWGYEDVLPCFKRSESYLHASKYHGTDGPLTVSDLSSPHPLTLKFLEAAETAGYERNPDFNGEQQSGAGLYQRTIGNDKRESTAAAFLSPVMERQNLTVVLHAEVTSLILDNRRAVAVRYIRNGEEHEVRSDGEIIVSGGAVNSPKLFMLSGIGPADHLQEMGIPVVLDLPGVGGNLQDHPRMPNYYSLFNPPVLHKGSNKAEAGMFCNADFVSRNSAPELQYHVTVLSARRARDDKLKGYFDLDVNICRPASRGSIRLRSSDPTAAPEIRPGYFSQRADMDLMIRGLCKGRELVRTMDSEGLLEKELIPGAKFTDDDGSLERAIRKHCDSIWHPVGTCKMGNDDEAVVDPQLRVHGIENIRVVDASVMPQITTGNTNAPTIMIAEKAAAMIRTKA